MKKTKLSLRPETIRVLSTATLAQARGAQMASPVWCATMRDVNTCGVNCIPTGSVW